MILSPALIHDVLGKALLSLISLAVPFVLLSNRTATEKEALFWPVHLLWTLNPIVLNITTRGSPEAIIVLIVVACFAALRRGAYRGRDGVVVGTAGEAKTGEARAAVLFALAVSFKIYPAIYTPTIWAALRRRHGLFGNGIWRFGAIAATATGLINGSLWLMYVYKAGTGSLASTDEQMGPAVPRAHLPLPPLSA